ncbi:MAG: hypothetical protein AAF378_14105 [Cyanobacteria bacterium P01_A01_bin.84]
MEKISEARLVEFVEYDEVSKYIEGLPLEQKQELAQKIGNSNPGGIIIIGGNNMISNSNVLQLNGSAEEISKQLKNISPEVLAELVKAIALDMRKKNQQKQ